MGMKTMTTPSKNTRPENTFIKSIVAGIFMGSCFYASAQTSVLMNSVDDKGLGIVIGTIEITESPHGLVFTPSLKNLSAGLHGFHIHQNPDCNPADKDGKRLAAQAAGAHYDPKKSTHHGTPWGEGHLGDLPALFVDSNGHSTQPVLAPRLKLFDIKNRALIIHEGGDNHSDDPEPLGGGGGRIACGLIQ
jgi:Cu-Zn family superoxide dismutase